MPVTAQVLQQQLAAVKAAGTAAAQAVMQQLQERFRPVELLEAFGILQPEFWLLSDAASCFKSALQLLIEHYCQEHTMWPVAAERPAPTARAAAARQATADEQATAAEASAATERKQQETTNIIARTRAVNAEVASLLPAVMQPEPEAAAMARLLKLQAQLQALEVQLGAVKAAMPTVQPMAQPAAAAPAPSPPPLSPAAAAITVPPLPKKQLLQLQEDAFAAGMAARALR